MHNELEQALSDVESLAAEMAALPHGSGPVADWHERLTAIVSRIENHARKSEAEGGTIASAEVQEGVNPLVSRARRDHEHLIAEARRMLERPGDAKEIGRLLGDIRRHLQHRNDLDQTIPSSETGLGD